MRCRVGPQRVRMPRLTKRVVDALEPPSDGRKDRLVFDDEIKGLGVRVTAAGRKRWLVQFYVNGQKRRMPLGATSAVTPDQARRGAKEVLGKVAAGRDPFADARARREVQRRRNEVDRDTVQRVSEDFIDRHARPRQRTWKETERRLRVYVLPTWGARPISEITRTDATRLLDRIVEDHGPVMANRVLNTVRKMFNWAAGRGVIEASPIAGLEPPGEERPRERVLADNELRAVWQAAEQLGWPWVGFLKVLILTGQRRREVAEMRWPELDLERGLWTIPGERVKNGRAHLVHLSPQGQEVIEQIRQQALADGPLVFTTTGRTSLSGFSKMKRRLDQLSDVSGWTLHDVRRTMVTVMAGLAIAPHVADRILNHVDGTIRGVARIYQRNEFLPQRKQALDAWGAYVSQLVDPEPASKVVPFRA